MNLKTGLYALVAAVFWAGIAAAQETAWLQVEARPTEDEAFLRADDYAAEFADVNGYRLASGWFAIALGPYERSDAELRLVRLRASGSIPSDSFLTDGRNFRSQFYASDTAAAVTPPAEPLAPLVPGEESLAEARAAERLLSRDDRALIQTALSWEGVYNSAIDADFGPGTRRAMAAWQEAQRFEPTGVLTTAQRQALVGSYIEALDALRMEPVADTTAGIEIVLPTGLVAFERYEPPFAHYAPATADGVRVLLISQTGDRDTLAALYEVMQTLEIVPLNGPRDLGRAEFTLTGANDRIVSHTYARAEAGTVKGFTLIWPAGDDKRRRLALGAMERSFRATDGVIPASLGTAAQSADLMSGLDIRKPERARSGFYVDAAGAVMTTSEAVAACGRITLEDDIEAVVVAEDAALGLALLKPRAPLSPLAVARLAEEEPRLMSEIAVAGYSYGGALPAPTLTYGTFADVKGLDGDMRVQRLDLAAEEGDAGGPVFDASGAVMGMLLPGESGARQLPAGVAFASDAVVLAGFLEANGLRSPAPANGGAVMAPEDLTTLAAGMTVLVSCWN